ncbi:hypothetical protein PIB30_077316 [Stylosanthes scabra]|uniref:Uncharacterized protein n=1 Tax=Stylosanthes scabra TaxID=79078 RepID=A0ABU6YN39_9FABA|nr:hypothetical protein [Stylosanthes scabra]
MIRYTCRDLGFTKHRIRAQVQGATTDFETQKEHDQLEIPVFRAILIQCIMKGEDVHAEDIIADKMVRMAQGIKEKRKLGFPSTIYKLCKEAGVPLREFRRTKKIQVEKPITARRMESTRLPRQLQHRQQDNEDEDQPMPQAEEGNEEGNEEGQGYEHDYHYHPEFDHQPEYEHHQDFQEEIQQQTLENINKSQAEYMAELRAVKGKQQEMYENNNRLYNQIREEQREMAKEIQQVKNYQVNQTMVDSARNKAIMDELAAVRSRQEEFFSNQTNQYNMIRQKQKLLGKEILDVKKYQISAVTMGSSSSPQKYEPDQALMKIREQHANISEMQRQLKEWMRNATARECYTVWAHQQANSNLVKMSSHKITKKIYDNIHKNRPMFYGLLKTNLPPSNSAPPPSSSNDPQNPPK